MRNEKFAGRDRARDARPFLAYHLRQRANERADANGAQLHRLARWVENLPAGDRRMARIEATDALGYHDGNFVGGDESEALIDSYAGGEDRQVRERWFDAFADAVVRYWASGRAR